MHVYACIGQYMYVSVYIRLQKWWEFYVLPVFLWIFMYMHVFWQYMIELHWIQQQPSLKLYCSGQNVNKGTQGHFWQFRIYFYCSSLSGHFSCSRLAKSWPRSWYRTRGFPSPGSLDCSTRPANSTQPCCCACYKEWCCLPQLELGAISQDVREWHDIVVGHTGQVLASGDTKVWFQTEQCWNSMHGLPAYPFDVPNFNVTKSHL